MSDGDYSERSALHSISDGTKPGSERTNTVRVVGGALAKKRRLFHSQVLEALLERFSPSERLVLYVLSVLLAASVFILLADINAYASVEIPVQGGTWTEGEVGPARFLNPLLTLSGPDEDLTRLVYSGLMRAEPDGTYVPDLASSYDISSDGTTYTFHIRDDATFQDGTPVTSADVAYTVEEAQNPDIRSPRQADWTGVSVSAPNTHTVVFTLPHAYAPFIEDTTMGILPKHLWQNVSPTEFPFSPLNTHPVGSGPYKVANVTTDSTGSVTRYDLVPFDNFTLGKPYLKRISFLFYAKNADLIKAFNAGKIDAIAGVSPADLSSITRQNMDIVTVPLPRVFGVFFNQNHAPVLADSNVRAALDAAIDKDAIVKSVLGGYGVTLQGPVPPTIDTNTAPATPVPFSPIATPIATSSLPNESAIDSARSILKKDGWTYDASSTVWTKKSQTLAIALATADEPELVATANQIVADWKALGVDASVQVYPLSDFNSNVLRPRQYDAILFGEVVGRSLDLFAFWHSSQRNDPGLNLAMYANSHADSLLTQARAETNTTVRNKLYDQFASIVESDSPAVFLFAPEFIYLVPPTVHGIELGTLTSPAERFLNVNQWYTDTAHVWSIFIK